MSLSILHHSVISYLCLYLNELDCFLPQSVGRLLVLKNRYASVFISCPSADPGTRLSVSLNHVADSARLSVGRHAPSSQRSE